DVHDPDTDLVLCPGGCGQREEGDEQQGEERSHDGLRSVVGGGSGSTERRKMLWMARNGNGCALGRPRTLDSHLCTLGGLAKARMDGNDAPGRADRRPGCHRSLTAAGVAFTPAHQADEED